MLFLSAVMVFLALVLAGFAAAMWLQQTEDARAALVRRLGTMAGRLHDIPTGPLLKDQNLSSIRLLNALLGSMPVVNPVVRMIQQSGVRRRVGEVLLYVPLLACSVLLLNALLGGSFIIGVPLAIVAGAVPLLIVSRMRRNRALRFAEQLPEALDLIRSALQAGHGVPGALAVVGETFPDPISYEFRYMVEEIRLGLTMREALRNLAQRVPDPNLPILSVGILVAQDAGGNLAEVVDNIAYTIRERFKLIRETRVLTAQGRLSGAVLTALPFALGLFMFIWNRNYFRPLIETRAGHLMIAYGIVSLLVGHRFIRRLVTIKV
jgi:tight adherence protein B